MKTNTLNPTHLKNGMMGCGALMACIFAFAISGGIAGAIFSRVPPPTPLEAKALKFQEDIGAAIYRAKEYVTRNAYDPDSVKFVTANAYHDSFRGIPLMTVYLEYRGKNPFGALILAQSTVTLDMQGNVTNVK